MRRIFLFDWKWQHCIYSSKAELTWDQGSGEVEGRGK